MQIIYLKFEQIGDLTAINLTALKSLSILFIANIKRSLFLRSLNSFGLHLERRELYS